MSPEYTDSMNRRNFIKASAAAVAGSALLTTASGKAHAADGPGRRNERPDRMTYRQLGRTNFMCSRLVFGCGAALAGGKAVRLLEQAYEAGINFYDVGYDDYYKGSERNLAPFISRHRGDVWITSKAPARTTSGQPFNAEQAKLAADYWLKEVDKSLERLDSEYVDAYYVMGASNPELLKSEEMIKAFEEVKSKGKVGHIGISTHQNAQECLETVIESKHYDLAMIAITPGGWYDYSAGKLLGDRGAMTTLRPLLDRAREAGVGLVGMKAARYISIEPYGGKYGKVNDESILTTFDSHYSPKLMQAALNPYQRSYAYVLENGLDVVNADMQNFRHFEENLFAVKNAQTWFA